MSGVTKRPAKELIETSSKRAKTDLPAGFFDRNISKSPVEAINDGDDEWARFQAELGEQSTIKTQNSDLKTKSRLNILGLNAGEGTITANAVLKNISNNRSVASDQGIVTRDNDQAATKEVNKNSSENKKTDIDAYIEEDAAEGLLAELDTQKELYDRVMKMKDLQSRVKQKLQSVQKNQPHSDGERHVLNEQIFDKKIEIRNSLKTSDEEDEEDDDDDDSDSLWRKRTL